jgi:hypothetical protein
MKIVCITNTDGHGNIDAMYLTIGKCYETINVLADSYQYYYIIDDSGNEEGGYYRERFVTLDLYREMQIDKLIT